MVCQVAILRVLLQITLLAMFIGFFGVPSLIRYQDSKVMVVVEEKDTTGIPAPAVTICARDERETKVISDACNRSVNVFRCMQSESWSRMKYVVLDAGKGWPTMKDLMGAQFWGLQIRSRFECFTLSINELIVPSTKGTFSALLSTTQLGSMSSSSIVQSSSSLTGTALSCQSIVSKYFQKLIVPAL